MEIKITVTCFAIIFLAIVVNCRVFDIMDNDNDIYDYDGNFRGNYRNNDYGNFGERINGENNVFI